MMKLSCWGRDLQMGLIIILLPLSVAQSNQTEANQNQQEKETNDTVTLIWTIVAIGLLISACVFSALLYRNYFGPCDMGFGMGGAAAAAGSNATSQTNPVQQIFAMPTGSQPMTINGGDKNNESEERDKKKCRDPDPPPTCPYHYYPYCAPMPMYPPPLPYPHRPPSQASPKSSRHRHAIPINTPSPSPLPRPPRTVSTLKARSFPSVKKMAKASSGEESSTSSRKSNTSRVAGKNTWEFSRSANASPFSPNSRK